MAESGFEVTAGELRTHAGKVDGHAQRMGQAANAAKTAMADGAYGIACQFLPLVLNQVERAAQEALTAGRDGLTDTARKLRETATDYESQDSQSGQRFNSLEGRPR